MFRFERQVLIVACKSIPHEFLFGQDQQRLPCSAGYIRETLFHSTVLSLFFIELIFQQFNYIFSFLAVKDPTTVERANLLNMAKLSIKGLIESALSFGRTLDSDYPPLQQFFVVMEHCLKHGLKGKLSTFLFSVSLAKAS